MNLPKPGQSVADWDPMGVPKGTSAETLLKPNAKDNPDSLTPDNPLKQATGKSNAKAGPLGTKGREF